MKGNLSMSDFLNIIIDGIPVKCKKGSTILEAASQAGIKIPTLCHDERTKIYGACGLCVVEAAGNSKLLRACSTQASDGMDIKTNTPRVISSRKCALDLLLSDHGGDCRPPCVLACPAGTDCQGYAGLVANGEHKEALKLVKEILPLPSSIGRVCPHPCETACRRKLVEEPVSIAAIKRFIGDKELEDPNKYIPELAEPTGKKVAIVGGGPAGLTAAYYLRIKGHAPTVFDMMPKMGGMLRYGIPEYRLPESVLDQEIEIIKDLGMEFVNNFKIGKDATLEQLRQEYDAVIIAIGAWTSSKMRVPGEDLEGVFGGIDFLREVALGSPPEIGKRVAVCGGGNTAMDACRTAVRLGAEEVYVIYRRTREEMPAEEIEIVEADEEGVVFKFLTNPVEISGDNGRITGVKLQKMQLGEPDASGRRRPVPVEGAFEELELDSFISAIGQQPALAGFEALDSTKWNTIIADESTFRTSVEGVFAVGDATNNGADIAISAIAEAQKACAVVDAYLYGKEAAYNAPYFVKREITAEDLKDRPKEPRAKMKVLSPEERKTSFNEIASVLSEEAAMRDAKRCLECGCHDFFECKLIHLAHQYDVTPSLYEGVKRAPHEDKAHPYIEQNAEKCILCGLCVRVCDEMVGVTALALVDRGFETLVSPEFCAPLVQTNCIACGQCVAVCPTGALREKTPFIKSVPVDENSVITVCSGCAAGCAVDLRYIGSTMTRALPAGAQGMLCAQGRFGFADANSPDRILTPLIKNSEGFSKVSFDETAEFFASHLSSVIDAHGKEAVGFAVAENTAIEEAEQIKALARQITGTENVFTFGNHKKTLLDSLGLNPDDAVYDRLFGEPFKKGANREGLARMGISANEDYSKLKALIVFGDDAPKNLPEVEFLALIASIPSPLTKICDVIFPSAVFGEYSGKYVYADGKEGQLKRAVKPKNGMDNLELLKKLQTAFQA